MASAGVEHAIESRMAQYQTMLDQLRQKATEDPLFAKSLLSKYNPKFPSPGYQWPFNYVMTQLPGPALAIGGNVEEPRPPIAR